MQTTMETRNIKRELQRLFQGEVLSKAEAQSVLGAIGRGEVNEFQITAFLTCYQMRKITGAELAGFRAAMIELALFIDFSEFETIDLCGTGGDGKDTFNISTAASFLVAGAGYKVAKHGNYGVSSGCGSSNVLEALGYKMTNDYDTLRSHLEQANFCYMHAPLFHPAMKEVGPIRKGMKTKTFFNMLGPLLNPSRPTRQITGVFSEELIPLYKAVFEDMQSEFAVIRSADGYDEISLTGSFRLTTGEASNVVEPADLKLSKVSPEDLHGGKTVGEAVEIFRKVLGGEGSKAQSDVVSANAGCAIQRFKPDVSLIDCIAEAREALESGGAKRALDKVVAV